MKKNVIAHMKPPKEPMKPKRIFFAVFSRVICLLLALLIWLLVVNAPEKKETDEALSAPAEVQTV